MRGGSAAPPPPAIDPCDDPSRTDGTCSPILLNLAGGAWNLSGSADPVSFDIDGDGLPNRITWTGRGEPLAFLALDRNANGRIDDGSELFGTATRLMSGARAGNGFDALEEFDVNSDGVVDRADPIWDGLLLWIDGNHDGVSQTDEIRRIAASELLALHTTYRQIMRQDREGNWFRYVSHVASEDGSRPYYDVFFRTVN